jgi:UPF0755 protein
MKIKNDNNQPQSVQRKQLGLISWGIVSSVLICLVLLGIIGLAIYIPRQAVLYFGTPADYLSLTQKVSLSTRLYLHRADLIEPCNLAGGDQEFTILLGESVGSITNRLQENGLIRNSNSLQMYLVYSGIDTQIQAGDYTLSPSSTAIEMAHQLLDATPDKVTIVILPGWRMEEIAASLPSAGIDASPAEFIQAARSPATGIDLGLPTEALSFEGFLLPDQYLVKRDTTASELVLAFLSDFMVKANSEIIQGLRIQGLNLYQGVILASIVQREAVVDDEQPLIASVFYNRITAGMTLGSDPTIQYALGYDNLQQTWWKNPLDASDLKVDSPFNTYLYEGLPPGPISNPSLNALRAVAFPSKSSYFYFRAACDGSGRHQFSATLEEHINNACP